MGLKWTEEEDAMLIEMLNKNKTVAEISARLKRTVDGIKTRRKILLGITYTPRPKEVKSVKKKASMSVREVSKAARESNMSYGEYVARMDGLI